MPPDEEDLRRRLAAVTPRDTVRGFVFNATLALVDELAGALAVCAADPGGPARRHELFSYPVADYLRIAWASVAALEPHLGPPERALREIGSRSAMRWFASPLGRVLAVLSGGDPRRALDRAPVAYRNMVSFGLCTVEWPAERHARLVFEGDFLGPAFHGGGISRGLVDLARLHARVEAREAGFLGAVVEVTW